MSKGERERERERENLLDSGKKKGKILKIILKKKKSLLFAQFSMLSVWCWPKKKKKCYLCNSPCCVFDVDKAWCMQPIVVVCLARGGQEHTHIYIYIYIYIKEALWILGDECTVT